MTPKGWIRRSVSAESISNLSGLGFSSVLCFIKDANVPAACVVWNCPKDSLDAPARKGAQPVPGAAHGVWSPSQGSLHNALNWNLKREWSLKLPEAAIAETDGGSSDHWSYFCAGTKCSEIKPASVGFLKGTCCATFSQDVPSLCHLMLHSV